MKKLFIAVCIAYSTYLYAQDNEIDLLVDSFNYQKINEIYMQSEQDSDDYRLMGLSYALSVTADANFGYGLLGLKHAEKSIQYGQNLNPSKLENTQKISYYYYMAKMYSRMIQDAASWMKYGKNKDKYLKLLLETDPEHIGGNLIKAENLLHLPESIGGNSEEGYMLLKRLNNEHPTDYRVLEQLAQYYLENKNNDTAEEFFKKTIKVNSNHVGAQNELRKLQIMNKNYKIRTITLKDGTKTKSSLILGKLKKYEGKTYNSQTQDSISNSVKEINSVKGIQITANPVSESETDLEIKADEDNMIIFGALGFFQLYPDYDKKMHCKGFPAVMYIDQNFLGTGNQLMLIFAGVYLMADYTINDMFGDRGPIVKTTATAYVLSMGGESYLDGKEIDDYAVHSPVYYAEIGIGKEYKIGFSAFLNNKIQYHIWDTDENDVDLPSHNYTYFASLPVEFSTQDKSNPSKLTFIEGFKLGITPGIIYKPGYDTWGNKNNYEYSFSHNNDPMLSFQSEVSFFTTLFERNNIGFAINYMTGKNYYQSEKWAAGATTMIANNPEVNGYYESEFIFTNGIITSLTYSLSVVPNNWVIFIKHDIFRDLDKKDTVNGTGVGTSVKLPYDIELTAKLGVGWDAERDNDSYGYDFQTSLTKMWFF